MKIHKLNIFRLVLWLAIFATMGTIFLLSGQKSEDSDKLTNPIINAITQDEPLRDENGKWILETFELREKVAFIARKSAHIIEYLFLAILFSIQFHLYGFSTPFNMSLTSFICLLYSVLDEYHQTFIPGRSGELRDVLFDLFGIVFGILITTFIIHLIKKKKQKREKSYASKEATSNG